MSSRARVILLNAALGPLDYRVPRGMRVVPGSIVVAPLGPRQLIGVVWEPERAPTDEVDDKRLRPLVHAYELPPLSEPLRRLIEWTADYYLAPLGAVLRMALPSTSALEGARTVIEYRATGHVPERLTPQRAQALERIGERMGLVRELAIIGGVSDGVIRGLVKAGAIEAVEVTIDDPFPLPDPDHDPPALEPAQAAAAAELRAAVEARAFAPFLLDGVTGSGKTEVYFEAIAEAVRRGRQTLVLLPEIALTEPFLKRFSARFGGGARRLAFGPQAIAAPPRLAGDRLGRGARRGRRPIGPLPALPKARPDRRRRGARVELQAGGRRRLSRPRRGGDARPVRAGAGRSSPRQRRRSKPATWSRTGPMASSGCPIASAARDCPRWRRST